jgi:trimeric autotransporter adhesin
VDTGCGRGRRPRLQLQRKFNMKINITPLVVLCLTFCEISRAVSPAPDGGYAGANTAEGQNAFFNLTTGTFNTGIGWFSLESNATGNFNTATGAGALFATTADENTATGAGALFSNSTGEANAAHGAFALFNNASGSNNTASGPEALFTNKTGRNNTATGAQALFFNDGDPDNEEASLNSAFGNGALFGNTTGEANSAFGSSALLANDTGNFNTAVGDEALFNNVDGNNNTGVGLSALANNTNGFANTAIGTQALINCNTGGGNTGLGAQSGFNVTTASNVICIGNIGGDNIDNSCFIANIYSNIQPVTGIDPDYVTIDSNGRLGRSNLNGSSRRFKHEIQPMETASEVIFGLRPVRFRYNKEYDAKQRLSFGLIAEDVAEVAPDLVGRNKQGEPDAVRYEQINAMLLNEFLKEHRKVQELEKGMATLITQLKEQAAQIQKVSVRVGMTNPTTNVVLNNQ